MPSDLRIVEPEDDDSVLPPGRRDSSGFWFPLHCADPRTLVRRRRARRVKRVKRIGESRRSDHRVA